MELAKRTNSPSTMEERLARMNRVAQEKFAIDAHLDVDQIPLGELSPGHPSLFQHQTMYKHFARLRREAPIHRTEDNMFGKYWSFTKHQDVLEIERNYKLFSSEQKYGGVYIGNKPYEEGALDQLFTLPMFIMMDPPKHTEQRKAVQPMFIQKSLNPLKPIIRDRAQAILDSLPIDEEFDWVPKVSIELTSQMLATLLDFPYEDRMRLIHWSDAATNNVIPELFDSVEETLKELWQCFEYLSKLFEERKVSTKRGQDLISMLAQDESTKDMPPNELLGNLLLLIVGGNDTVRNAISGGVKLFCEFPEEYDRLAQNPKLLRSAILEALRMHTPLPHMARTAMADTEFRGTHIKKGERLALWYTSANRDEEVFPDPDRFIIDRPNIKTHLAFGYGIHRCVGYRLAEMQLQVLWEEIIHRFKRLELAGDAEYLWSNFVHGITKLPVKVHSW